MYDESIKWFLIEKEKCYAKNKKLVDPLCAHYL